MAKMVMFRGLVLHVACFYGLSKRCQISSTIFRFGKGWVTIKVCVCVCVCVVWSPQWPIVLVSDQCATTISGTIIGDDGGFASQSALTSLCP